MGESFTSSSPSNTYFDDDDNTPFDFKDNEFTASLRSSPTPMSTSSTTSSLSTTTFTSPPSHYDYHHSTPNRSHRTKVPIKPALKNGKTRSLSSTTTATSPSSPTGSSTTAFENNSKIYSYNTPSPSSSLSQNQRRHSQHSRRDDISIVDYEEEYDDTWRKDGKELRTKLIDDDDASGGSEFIISLV
jgi:hypothetical protein